MCACIVFLFVLNSCSKVSTKLLDIAAGPKLFFWIWFYLFVVLSPGLLKQKIIDCSSYLQCFGDKYVDF